MTPDEDIIMGLTLIMVIVITNSISNM